MQNTDNGAMCQWHYNENDSGRRPPFRCLEGLPHPAYLFHRPPHAACSFWGVGLMHLLYFDEASAANDPNQQCFVLTGVSVFERETHWVEQKRNNVAQRFSPSAPHGVELHGSHAQR